MFRLRLARATLFAILALVLLVQTATPVSAAIVEKHENFTDDTVGDWGNLNLYWGPYGNTIDKKARVTFNVPTASPGKPVFVQKVVFEMHDHDESIEFEADAYVNGVLTSFDANITPTNKIDTTSDRECGRDREPGGAFIRLRHPHHTYPDATNPDKNCYTYHTVTINQPIEALYLTFQCHTQNCRNSWEEHVHIRNYVWYVEDQPQQDPVPDPQVDVLGCVLPNASQQTSDLVRFTWGDPKTKIQTVNISDSPASNRWESPAGRFWSKETRGQLTVGGPTGFTARTPNTSSPLIFRPGVTYTVILWDGARLSKPKDFSFQTCPQQVPPATATLTSACVNRNSGQPLSYDFNLNSIDTKGGILTRAALYLDLQLAALDSPIKGFLGTPTWSDWETANRAPQVGDRYGYLLANYVALPPYGYIPFTWNDTVIIGGTKGNQRTLSQLETWATTQGTPQNLKVSALITTVSGGNTINSQPAASTTVEVSKTACVQNPVCIPTCNACSIGGDSDSCGGVCPAGPDRGAPNPVQILIPAPGDALTVTQNNVTISWRQQPTNNPAARLVDTYQVLLYPTARYSSVDAAIRGFNQKQGDVVFFYQLAAQNYPANVYTRQVALPQAILNAGNITIAIKSLNLSCPGSNVTTGNPTVPATPPPTNPPPTNPPPTNPPPTDPPWIEDPDVPLEAAFSGNFYKSDSCNLAGAQPLTLSSSSFVTVTNSNTNQEYSDPANGTGYSISIPPTTTDYFARLSFDQAGQSETLACSACNPADANGFCQRPRTTGPTDTAHFFLESYDLKFDSWWQARGGLVYGHTSIRSALPVEAGSHTKNQDCIDAGEYCQPFLIRKTVDETELSAGIPLSAGSFINLDDWWTDRSDNARANNGLDIKSKITVENFSYFMGQMEEEPSPDITRNISSLGDIPGGRQVRDAKVSYRDGDLSFSPDQTWVIPSGEKRVIFVKGNLSFSQIPDKIIRVEPGGFLAFIVSGDITFDATVGHLSPSDIVASNSLEPNVEGVFIANGNIVVQSAGSDDKKFVGAGSFVGWTGVSLQRTFEKDQFGRVRNNTTPVENFLYRPDFFTNAPDLLKSSAMTWREVN